MLPTPHVALVSPDAEDSKERVRNIELGSESAFSALYDRTSALLNGLALRVTRDATAAEDTTLDVFTQARRPAERYDPKAGTPVAWPHHRTRSRAIDRLRARHRPELEAIDLAVHVSSSGPRPEDDAPAHRRAIVVEALLRLFRDQQRVVELAYFSGLSHTRTAARLEQPLGTVKTRVRLGMQELRRRLDRARIAPL